MRKPSVVLVRMDPQQKEEAALQPFSDGEQAPIGKGMELLLYLDESGKQLLKASKIRGMTDEQLVAAHRDTTCGAGARH